MRSVMTPRVGPRCAPHISPGGVCLIALATFLAASAASVSTARAGNPLPMFVNSTADGPDALAGDGLCQTATAGECTLRAAIEEANALPGVNSIAFNIPSGSPWVIQVNSSGHGPSPVISSAMTIDATTQPGWSINTPVVIDGMLDPGPSNGISVSTGAEGSVIKGFHIEHFVNGIGVFNVGVGDTRR